jgi:hypothetical protein
MAFVRAADVGEAPGGVGSPQHTNDLAAHQTVEDEHAHVGAVLRPIRNKVRPDEVADQLVLASSKREALAESGVEFAREFGFIARQRRDDFRHDPNAQRHSSCGER